MQAEMTEQLGYEKSDQSKKETENRRNGKTTKTLRNEQGPLEIEVSRDQSGDFEPEIVPKHQRDFKGFDYYKILAMYSRGMTTRNITETPKEIYGTEVSPELISRVTDSVKELLDEWRTRPLSAFYPVAFLDALVINVKDNAHIVRKSIFLALRINHKGSKELMGLWIEENEGAKFWLGILNELINRGVQDILIAAVDGLARFPEAITTVFPQTEAKLCIVHMVRNSLKYVPNKDRKTVATGLKTIYLSPSDETAAIALNAFAEKWDAKYPMIARSWRTRWPEIIPFLKFPEIIRKMVYTTNAIESVNYTIRKVTRNRQSFPTTDAALKLVYMALQNIPKKWTMPVRDWGAVLNQFAVIYGSRVPI